MAKKRNIFEEILKLPSDDKFLYDYITSTDEKEETPSPTNIYAPPTDANIKAGVMNRFFVARYDSETASEVTGEWLKENESDLPESIYSTIKIRWYLKDGINKETYKVLHEITAEALNESIVDRASIKMPQLEKTIKDFTKFVG